MGKKNPVVTKPCEAKGVILQKATKAGISTFKAGYNYSKKLGSK